MNIIEDIKFISEQDKATIEINQTGCRNILDEIEALKIMIDIKQKRIDKLNRKLDNRDKKVDKAVEYIKEHSCELETILGSDDWQIRVVNELLNILKGEDKE